ncbi:MAG: hypothetical protein AAGN64_02450, partial [Bacteroidota bacterium]
MTEFTLKSSRSPDEKRIERMLTEFMEQLSRESQPFADVSAEATRARYDSIALQASDDAWDAHHRIDAFGQLYFRHYWKCASCAFHADLDAMLTGRVETETRRPGEIHIDLVHGPREHAKSVRARAVLLHAILTGWRRYPLVISEHLYLAQAHLDYTFIELTANRRVLADFEIDVQRYDRAEGVLMVRVTP